MPPDHPVKETNPDYFKDPPLVSICIPTYNRADMVGMAIESALAQSYPNIEVIVVDNASTDSTALNVSRFNDSRLKYEKNSRNLGLFGNFNRCIELAKGKYIHILHSDDFIGPDFTKTCVRVMEANPHIAMTFSAAEVIRNENHERIDVIGQNKIFPAPEGFRQILSQRNLINCPSVIIKREVYEKVGHYSCEYPYAADFDQWLKISRIFDIAYISDATLYYRQGEHSESFRQLFRSASGYLDVPKIFIHLLDDFGTIQNEYTREINIALRRHTRDCLYAGLTRERLQTGYSPSVYFGIAFTTWALLRPNSLESYLQKLVDLFITMGVWGVSLIPGGRYFCKTVLMRKKKFY